MDTNPLAADPAVVINGNEQCFKNGLLVLTRFLEGTVYLCKAEGAAIPQDDLDTLIVSEFSGPHPAGLSGTHIHFLDPVNRKKSVWSINYQDVIAIGHLFTTGKLLVDRVIALAGPQVERPRLVRTRLGASIAELVEDELKAGENRIVSGSLLCGRHAAGEQAYLGRYHQQVSVIREGREQEFIAWLKPGKEKFSVFNLFSSKLAKGKRFGFSTTTAGDARPMVPVGTYEVVMPLDILPTPLLRALIVGDIETAEALGCLELDEEDLALCTYVCPGKYDYGQLLRESLNRILKEG
jgi:Na+-transporting NADH:ubiquinone oxidoreductase subunit A